MKDNVKSITNRQSLDSSKLFADNNFRFDENGKKFSKLIENTIGKREKQASCDITGEIEVSSRNGG